MANPTGKGGKRFQKGQSGNPGGGRKKDPLIEQFKETTYKDFLAGLQKYGKLSREEMQRELMRPDATMFEIMFGQIVASAAKGDKDARQVLLDRLWGKIKETAMPVTLENSQAEVVIIKMPDNGRTPTEEKK